MNINESNPIGFISENDEDINDIIEVLGGKFIKNIIIDGSKVTSLYTGNLTFFIKKEFSFLSIVTNSINNPYFENGKNIFQYIDNYKNDNINTDLLIPSTDLSSLIIFSLH